MIWTQSVWQACGIGILSALALAVAPTAHAANLEITFSGMGIVYDGTNIYDAGSNAGGNGNPAEADPLIIVNFSENGSLVGSISDDVSLDVFIPDVTGIPAVANAQHLLVTPGNPGYFDLLIGTAPAAAEYLRLELGEVGITYLDTLGTLQFTFGAAVASGSNQNLPFGLVAGELITVSFSSQVDPDTLTEAGGLITGFTASGSGVIRAVPEPATVGLVVLGVAAVGLYYRRRS